MNRCLNDIQIQAVVDGEAGAAERAHVATCGACAARVARREQQIAEIEQTLNAPVEMPASLAERVQSSLATGTAGATRLRTPSGGGRRRWIYSGFAVAAATLVAVLFIVPTVRKRDTTVSAAEILARSASQLAAAPARNVDFLVYELVLDGVPREMMPDHENGTGAYRVQEVIDHSVPGRFRLASYDPSGVELSSVAQDPASGRRVMALRVDGQAFRFESTLPAAQAPSLPEIERLHMQASIALMQASGNPSLQIVDSPDGREYRIDVPRVTTATPAAVWDLTEAHLIVDASDFHVVEFAVKGAFLRQPYSFSYKLLTHDVQSPDSVPPETFDVPAEHGAIVIHAGEGSPVPAADAFQAALRELAKARQTR
jgi:anti-sigma factor RsiW